MKKYLVLLIIISILLFAFTSCSGISSEQFEEVSVRLSEAETAKNDLQTQLTDMQKKYDNLNTAYDVIKAENEEYETIIKPYKELTESEIALKQKETQAELDKFAEEEEKKEAEEKAAKEAEEKKGYNTGIKYTQLARTPDNYIGKKVKFRGEVVQVVEGDESVQLRFAVDGDYDKMLFVEYEKSIVKFRVLEDDEITIYGTSLGLFSYESTASGTITIPSVLVDKIDQ